MHKVMIRASNCTIATMPYGSYGKDSEGNIYYRGSNTALCLNDPGCSYTNNADIINTEITLSPPGSVIEILVSEYHK